MQIHFAARALTESLLGLHQQLIKSDMAMFRTFADFNTGQPAADMFTRSNSTGA